MKSRLDLTPFGVGVSSGIKARCHILRDMPWLYLSAHESVVLVSSNKKVSVPGECVM